MTKINENICRIVLIITLIATIILAPLEAQAFSTSGQTINTLQKELQNLRNQKAIEENSKTLTQSEINSINALSYRAYQEKEAASKEVEEAKEKIIESEAEIAEVTEKSNELMRYMQVLQNSNAFMEYIQGANSMTELIMRAAGVEQIQDYNQQTMKNLENLIIENQDLQVELEKKQIELTNKINNYATNLSKLRSDLATGNDAIESIDSQIKNMQTLINYYKTVCTTNDQPLEQCVRILNDTGWNKPLVRGVVTSLFGWRKNPLTGASYSDHYGTDIGGNAEGTSVYAAAAGMVAAITVRSNCGGNMVYIHHIINGRAYTTQYAHLLNYNVKVGDSVTAATKIGEIGGGARTRSYDRCSTGAHLHFNIATGHYLGSGNDGYSSWNKFKASSVAPSFFPSKGVWWYSR